VTTSRARTLQLALGTLAAALFLAAIAVLLVPGGELPQAAERRAAAPQPTALDPPLYAIANDPESPLVERNPFDGSRRAPTRRRTLTTAEENAAAAEAAQSPPPTFVLLGTVVIPSGRNIAVIAGNPLVPGGSTYHVGDEVQPGFRVIRITRDAATIVGNGRRFDLTLEGSSTAAPPQ
jgi:hypothetical protein